MAENLGPIKVIPKNKENYIYFTTFSKGYDGKFFQTRIVDSFEFLGTRLEKFANGLDQTDFVHLKQCFTKETKFKLMTRKGVYIPTITSNLADRFRKDNFRLKKVFIIL